MSFSKHVASLQFFALVSSLTLCSFAQGSPAVTLSPTSLNFGNVQVGTTSAPQTITVTNSGTGTLKISNVKFSSGSSRMFKQSNNCTPPINPGGSCTITVTFLPTVTGTLSTTVTITDNAADSPQNAPVTGVGTAPAATVSVTNLTFAGQLVGTTSAPQTANLTNTGTAPLTISSVTPSGDYAQSNNCGASVAVGASCSITVTFTPTNIWTRSGSVVISDNAYGNPNQVLLLAGLGDDGGIATVSPTTLNFGNQTVGTTSTQQTITLTNTGTSLLNLNSVIATGDYSQTNTCTTSLRTQASCTITVTFTPSTTGTRTGYITFNDTDVSYLQTTTLSGTGTAAKTQVTVSPIFLPPPRAKTCSSPRLTWDHKPTM